METIETATATATCDDCGAPFEYEPIIVMGRDLARSLNRVCENCTAARDKVFVEERRKAEVLARREIVQRTLPPNLLPVSIDTLGTDPAHPEFNVPMWKLVKRWRSDSRGSWLALLGGAGQCKTRCMALYAEMAIMGGHRVVWTSAMRLYTEATMNLRSRDRNLAQVAREHLAECATAAWLFLDDLGKNEWSAPFESQLFTILDHRINYRLPMVYTSNAHPAEFDQSITGLNAAAIIGRLTEGVTILDFDGDKQMHMGAGI